MWEILPAFPTEINNFYIPLCRGWYFFPPWKSANKHTYPSPRGHAEKHPSEPLFKKNRRLKKLVAVCGEENNIKKQCSLNIGHDIYVINDTRRVLMVNVRISLGFCCCKKSITKPLQTFWSLWGSPCLRQSTVWIGLTSPVPPWVII